MNTYHSREREREREVKLISKTVLLNQLRPNVKWPLILNQYVWLYCHCCCTVLIELTTKVVMLSLREKGVSLQPLYQKASDYAINITTLLN